MYHPVLLQTEVLQDLPGLVDDLRSRTNEPAPAQPYRSEAFAEDLHEHLAEEPEPSHAYRRAAVNVVMAMPVGLALVGALVAVVGHLH